MADLVSFPAKYLGSEKSSIASKTSTDSTDFIVFGFVRPVYFPEAAASFSIEQLPDKPNFKKWVKADDVEQLSILNSLEVNKIHSLRWLVTAQYDKESKKNKLGYTALPPLPNK